MVNQQVAEIFQDMGVESIKTMGVEFDPNFHEAVAAEQRDDVPANTILEEMLRGYRIGNRVIRHSMVKVTTGPAAQRRVEQVLPPIPEPAESLPETAIDFPDMAQDA
jgi:molecular chaperone GrpE